MNNGLTPAEVSALKQEIFASLHCALPGMVESFDEDAGTACIRLALSKLPVLRDVPVFAGNDVHIGDLCLVVFADCDVDAWLETGEPGEPASGRKHSLSDAFAFVGFRTMHNA